MAGALENPSKDPSSLNEAKDVSSHGSTRSSIASTTDPSSLSEGGEGGSLSGEAEDGNVETGIDRVIPVEDLQKISIGDIPQHYWSQISMNVHDFNGRWQIMLERSDSVERIMKALGFGIIARKVMATYVSQMDFAVINSNANTPTMEYVSHLPLGKLKRAAMKFDGSSIEIEDGDTGVWKTNTYWIDGRAIQKRENSRGVMTDVRAIFKNDPLRQVDVPVMLFLWTFTPSGSSTTLSANRWFKKLQ